MTAIEIKIMEMMEVVFVFIFSPCLVSRET
jgi:hypothetical protein